MAKTGVTLDQIWKMAESLPGVEKAISWGSPALKVKAGGKLQLMACVPTHKTAEPGSLMFRVNREARAGLLEDDPETYYAPEHYLGYDAVLVRLERVSPELARDLLTMSWRFVTQKKKR
jgi:hypothetical protein